MSQSENHKIKEIFNLTESVDLTLDSFEPVKITNFSTTFSPSRYVYETEWELLLSSAFGKSFTLTLNNFPDDYISKLKPVLLYKPATPDDLNTSYMNSPGLQNWTIIKQESAYILKVYTVALSVNTYYKVVLSAINPNLYYELRTRKA